MANSATLCKECSGEEMQLQNWLWLVRSRANSFREKGVETDDLVQEGVIGLLNAIRAYDASRGASFETFAYHCITNRMRSAVMSAVKFPGTISLDSDDTELWAGDDPQETVVSKEYAENWRLKAE